MPASPAQALFAKTLLEALEARGFSQRALGDALGLGKRTGSTRINRYERLASECDFDMAQRIATTLEVPLD